MPEINLEEAIKRIKTLEVADNFLKLQPHTEEVEEISFRLKTFQHYDVNQIHTIYQRLKETYDKIHKPEVSRESVPIIVRDLLRWAGLGTQVQLSYPQAQEALRKAYRAAEAMVEYYNKYPGKPFNYLLARDIVANNLIARKYYYLNRPENPENNN